MKIISLISGLPRAAQAAHAAETLVLSGMELANRQASCVYTGILSPLGEAADARRWVVRHWFDRITYRDDSGGQEISTDALGYQARVGNRQWGLYAAARLAHTRLRPGDPGNAERGAQTRFFPSRWPVCHPARYRESDRRPGGNRDRRVLPQKSNVLPDHGK